MPLRRLQIDCVDSAAVAYLASHEKLAADARLFGSLDTLSLGVFAFGDAGDYARRLRLAAVFDALARFRQLRRLTLAKFRVTDGRHEPPQPLDLRGLTRLPASLEFLDLSGFDCGSGYWANDSHEWRMEFPVLPNLTELRVHPACALSSLYAAAATATNTRGDASLADTDDEALSFSAHRPMSSVVPWRSEPCVSPYEHDHRSEDERDNADDDDSTAFGGGGGGNDDDDDAKGSPHADRSSGGGCGGQEDDIGGQEVDGVQGDDREGGGGGDDDDALQRRRQLAFPALRHLGCGRTREANHYSKYGTRRLQQMPPHRRLQSVHVGDTWLEVEDLRELATTVARDFPALREIVGSSRSLEVRELLSRLPAAVGRRGPMPLRLSTRKD
jgi:hypothetical protein